MKKNFFKKLSFVLALAMIVSTLAPAAGVFAASKQTLNSAKKYLYLGEEKRNEFDFNISNKVKGSSYKWTSKNAKVAAVDKATGLTTAVGVGTTTVSVAITKKGAKTVTLKATVIVKDNIKTIGISNKPDKAVAVATDYAFNTTVKTKAGASASKTSKVVWIVDSAKATVSDKGVFNATETGTYKVTVLAFQSGATYDAWKALNDVASTKNVLASDSVSVKVVNVMTGVKQLNASKADLSFKAPVVKADVLANLTVSSLVGTSSTKVKQIVKSVTMSADSKTATVEIYGTFSASTAYVFDYTDMAPVQFTGATANLADVVDMQITTTAVKINQPEAGETDDTESNVNIALLNKDGVDIGSIDTSLRSRITSTSSSEKVWFNTAVIPNQLTFYTAGDTTTITAVFHTYDYDTATGAEKGALTRTAVITGVAASANAVSNISAYSLVKAGDSAPNSNFTSVNKTMAVEDTCTLYVKAVKADGTSYVNNLGVSGNTGWKFESSDASVLIVNTANNLTGTVYGVKAGSANVVVKYCEDTTVSSPTWTVVAAIPVTVGAKRVATTLNLGSYSFSLSNRAATTKTVSVEVLDQYGVAMTSSASVVPTTNTNTYANPKLPNPVYNGPVAKNITFDAVNVTAGTYTVTVKATVDSTSVTRYVNVTVQAPSSSAVASYKLSLSNSTFDAKVSADTSAVTNNISIIGVASNGVAVVDATNAAASTSGYSVKVVNPDGNEVLIGSDYLVNGVAHFADYKVASVSGGSQFVQTKVGTYTVKLFLGSVLKDAVNFTVTNTQPACTFTVEKLTSTAASGNSILGAIRDCFRVYTNGGANVTDDIYVLTTANTDYIGSDTAGTSVFIKNVRYNETINVPGTGNVTLTHVIAVNTQITLKSN